ncbi:MAG TPA: hypothetical protein VF209_05480 [Patescibacteria group bacterium]
MRSIKNFFLITLWLVVMSAGIYVAYNRGVIKVPLLAQKDSSGIAAFSPAEQGNWEKAFAEASSQIGILSQRGAETANTSSQVLGEFIQVNEAGGEKSTSEKALEYGRYLYCQQVVKEWEQVQQ